MRKLFFTLLLVMALAVSTPAGVLIADLNPPTNGTCQNGPAPDGECGDTQTTQELEPGDISSPGFTTIIVITILDLIH